MNLYTPQPVGDLNGDSVEDWVQMYGGDALAQPDSRKRLAARVLLVSGADGVLLSVRDDEPLPVAVKTPDARESYYSPQFVTLGDQKLVLYGTGGETIGGSFYRVALDDLRDGKLDKACCPVVLSPFILISTLVQLIDASPNC